MNWKKVINIFSIIVGIFLVKNPAIASCDITKAIYTDMDNKGFELRFGEPPISAVVFATATLWHPQRGNIGSFEVVTSQGFGTIYFGTKSNLEGATDYRISVYFFAADLKTDFEKEASTYMFVANLGSWDWYANQMSGGRDIFLGNPMWKLDRCR